MRRISGTLLAVVAPALGVVGTAGPVSAEAVEPVAMPPVWLLPLALLLVLCVLVLLVWAWRSSDGK